jgi:hypothetical protein
MDNTFVDSFIPMLNQMKASFETVLEDYFSTSDIQYIVAKAQSHFEQARSLLPDVSATSPWLKNLIGITYEIGLWKALEQKNLSLKQMSILNQQALILFSNKMIPADQLKTIRNRLCSAEYTQEIATDSTQYGKTDDWVIECIYPTPNDTFDIGMNIHRCPIKILCEKLHAERYFPYLCLNDFVIHSLLGVSLTRTQTLAHGAPYCDFRLTASDTFTGHIISEPTQAAEFNTPGADQLDSKLTGHTP